MPWEHLHRDTQATLKWGEKGSALEKSQPQGPRAFGALEQPWYLVAKGEARDFSKIGGAAKQSEAAC
ncbi:hypothetical protein GN956_G26574 [Arapaima gigas]